MLSVQLYRLTQPPLIDEEQKASPWQIRRASSNWNLIQFVDARGTQLPDLVSLFVHFLETFPGINTVMFGCPVVGFFFYIRKKVCDVRALPTYNKSVGELLLQRLNHDPLYGPQDFLVCFFASHDPDVQNDAESPWLTISRSDGVKYSGSTPQHIE